MSENLPYRDLAYSGLLGAAALLLPVVFHLIHLGHVFMPMYLPLVALAFFVGPLHAALTALIVPLLSALVTGMPPLYPPVAICMALELATMCWLLALLRRRWPSARPLWLLVPVLALGRVVYLALAYSMASVFQLPAKVVAGLSLIAGWPGVVLMVIVVPLIVRVQKELGFRATTSER